MVAEGDGGSRDRSHTETRAVTDLSLVGALPDRAQRHFQFSRPGPQAPYRLTGGSTSPILRCEKPLMIFDCPLYDCDTRHTPPIKSTH